MVYLNRLLNILQEIGKALWLPIAVLPAAGLLLRLGHHDLLDNEFLSKAGGAIFANLGLLFAIGIAGGLAKDKHISSGLSGAIVFLVMQGAMLSLSKNNDMGTLGGIIAGLTAGYLYNKYHRIKLPIYLSFFGGRRFIPIIASFSAIILAVIFGYIWPYIATAINGFSNWVVESSNIGLFVYGLTNRILLPTGLQHITEALAYFVVGSYTNTAGEIVTGDLNRFFALDPNAGMFMSGFFPVMIFGLPAAALAMYQMAKPKNKPMVIGIFVSGALTAALTGVTEPIEFPILFSAPLLYAVHAVLMGVSYVVTNLIGYKAGFTFSGGVIDLALSWGISTKPYLIFIVGPIFSAIYYFTFIALIKTFNLKTPGREEGELANKTNNMFNEDNITDSQQANAYFAALGGKNNVLFIDNCISRLRLDVKDINLVNADALKQLGAKGVVKKETSVQVVIGVQVESVANMLKDYHKQ